MQINYRSIDEIQAKNDVWVFIPKQDKETTQAHLPAFLDQVLDPKSMIDGLKKEVTVYHNKEVTVHFFYINKANFISVKTAAAEAIYLRHKHAAAVSVSLDAQYMKPYLLEALAEGFWWGAQNLGLHKSESRLEASWGLTVYGNLPLDEGSAALQRGSHTGEILQRIGSLVNEPGNVCTPRFMADFVVKESLTRSIQVQVHDASAIQEKGLWALWNVGKGRSYPPVLIEMDYHPPQATRTIGLVGKGVTFDTGGVSLKDGKNMHYMKSDMGGAAAVIGTILAAADCGLPYRIVGIVPSAENHIDRLAYRPGDVIPSYSGKTIEIINTDAEGRLLLADGISYILKNYKLDHLIDLATLTGSAVQTLGYQGAALFCNDESLADALRQSSAECGEKIWPFPLWEEYQKELESTIADIRHFHNSPLAGAIVAAKFLESFLDGFPSWAHLDIAPVALKETVFSKEKIGTGFGIDLLIRWLTDMHEASR